MSKNKLEHIAIICDGNGRWATERGLPRSEGHKYGKKAFVEICNAAAEMEIAYLTVYGFSTENWNRSSDEVQKLMELFSAYIQNCLDMSAYRDFKFTVLGSRKNLNPALVEKIEELEKRTCDNTGLSVQIAFNYGGRDELIRAVQEICVSVKNEELQACDIAAETVAAYMDTRGIPDPDVIIRTGGEKRLSNFMLWQCAYAELFFEDKYWPDFDKSDLQRIVGAFENRNRKFGAVNG